MSKIDVEGRLLSVVKSGLENRKGNFSRQLADVKCSWRTRATKGDGAFRMMTLDYSRTRESKLPDLDLEFGREVLKEGECRRC